jgi:hypothetical protein
MMPNEPCHLCEGTSVLEHGERSIKCHGCGGSGVVRPAIANYPFCVENVQNFVLFLRACGGFEIW